MYEWQITNALIYTLVKVLLNLPISIIIKRKLKLLFHDQNRTDASLQETLSEELLYFCSCYSTNFVSLESLRVYKKIFQWKQKSPHDLVNFNCSNFYLFLLGSTRSRGWKWMTECSRQNKSYQLCNKGSGNLSNYVKIKGNWRTWTVSIRSE